VKRKDFLQLSAAGGMSLALWSGIASCGRSVGPPKWKGKRLVLIQLVGGHDGLFAFAPRGHEVLEQKRPNLNQLVVQNGVDISDAWVLNGMLKGLSNLIENGELLLIPGVGYDNPNRSHFKAQEFWDTGEVVDRGKQNLRGTGWLGRFWESELHKKQEREFPFINLHSGRTLYDRGLQTKAYNITDLEPLKWYADYFEDFINSGATDQLVGEEALIYLEMQKQFKQLKWLENTSSFSTFTDGSLTQQLKRATEVIQSDLPYAAIHTQLGGFDTHGGQLERLTDLYPDFAGGLAYLSDKLRESGHWKDTLVFVYSDFGRTIDENRSGGTDHGYSGLSMLAGGDLSRFEHYQKPKELKFTEVRGELFLDYTTDYRDLQKEISQFLV